MVNDKMVNNKSIFLEMIDPVFLMEKMENELFLYQINAYKYNQCNRQYILEL
jgi:hypothetical protein